MRTIKFRGKRLDNGEWVHGDLQHRAGGQCAIVVPEPDGNGVWGYAAHFVDPATVGQFTGLQDKHGREIYEGDVVYIAGWGNTEMIFPFTDLYDSLAHTEYGSDIENVIGNIHDHPELLEQ